MTSDGGKHRKTQLQLEENLARDTVEQESVLLLQAGKHPEASRFQYRGMYQHCCLQQNAEMVREFNKIT